MSREFSSYLDDLKTLKSCVASEDDDWCFAIEGTQPHQFNAWAQRYSIGRRMVMGSTIRLSVLTNAEQMRK